MTDCVVVIVFGSESKSTLACFPVHVIVTLGVIAIVVVKMHAFCCVACDAVITGTSLAICNHGCR